MGGQGRRQVERREDHYATHLHGGSQLGQRAVAATIGAQVHDDRSGFHALHDGVIQQLGSEDAADEGRGDDHIHLGAVVRQQLRLQGLVLRRQVRGIAAARGGGLLEVDAHVLAAHGFDLLLHLRAHVRGRHAGPEPLGRGDGLQARHARSDDEHLGGQGGAGGGDEHGEVLRQFHGAQQHTLVAHQVRLARQRVHGLGPGGAGDAVGGEGGEVALRHALHRIEIPRGED